MEAVTVKINPKTTRGKHLLALLQDMAKYGNDISIEDLPNRVTEKAIKQVNSGKVTSVKNKEELFEKLGI
jgi:hypothetical protein